MSLLILPLQVFQWDQRDGVLVFHERAAFFFFFNDLPKGRQPNNVIPALKSDSNQGRTGSKGGKPHSCHKLSSDPKQKHINKALAENVISLLSIDQFLQVPSFCVFNLVIKSSAADALGFDSCRSSSLKWY